MMDERVGIFHSVWENHNNKGYPVCSDEFEDTPLSEHYRKDSQKKYTVHSHSIDIFSI